MEVQIERDRSCLHRAPELSQAVKTRSSDFLRSPDGRTLLNNDAPVGRKKKPLTSGPRNGGPTAEFGTSVHFEALFHRKTKYLCLSLALFGSVLAGERRAKCSDSCRQEGVT